MSGSGIFGGLRGVGDMLTRNARVHGHKLGLVFEDTRLSWAEVNARSCRFANELRKLGVKVPGQTSLAKEATR